MNAESHQCLSVTEYGVWVHKTIMYLAHFDCGSKNIIRSIPVPVPPNILDTQNTMINDIFTLEEQNQTCPSPPKRVQLLVKEMNSRN